MGITQPVPIQIGGMNAPLKNSIWNELVRFFELSTKESFVAVSAQNFFKVVLDFVPLNYPSNAKEWLRKSYEDLPWWQVYDFLQFASDCCGKAGGSNFRRKFENRINEILKRENSGYSFINGIISPLSHEAEIEAIEEAISQSGKFGIHGAETHLNESLKLLGRKPDPDYRNSIKEAISAVESVVKCISGVDHGGLDKAFKVLDQKTTLHSALKEGFMKLYGYTSDEDGIRHAIIDQPNVGLDEARFMVVACSAFVHFLISKADAAGLLK